jgi:leucyl-tRNA synthetase
VFTTRADTIFGATYLVLAPEHPLVARSPPTRSAPRCRRVPDAHGQAGPGLAQEHAEKTGVFTGAYAVNPATGSRQIPVWIADYVLMEYGTGAIMAVPGHDERDFEFAQVFGCPSCAWWPPRTTPTTRRWATRSPTTRAGAS